MFYTENMKKGGAQRVISNLANYFCIKNDVCIVGNDMDDISYDLNKKINTIDLLDKKINNRFIRISKKMLNTLKISKEQKPDIIISFLPIPSFKILLLSRLIKSKIIVSDRNDPNIEYKKITNKLLMKLLYPKADGFIFQTKEQRNYFSKKIQKKSIVIPNPLKEEFIFSIESSKILKENIIINVGKLHKQKNQKMLIDAFANITPMFPKYKLEIFGEGELQKELKEHIKYHNLEKKIKLCGISNNIKNELLKSKLFILSSDYEGMPNALMEAMACGLPCISTDCPCGGSRELIEHEKNGLLTPVNDCNQMTKKIIEVLSNPKKMKKLSINAKKIQEKYEHKKICKKWEKYIIKVINDE